MKIQTLGNSQWKFKHFATANQKRGRHETPSGGIKRKWNCLLGSLAHKLDLQWIVSLQWSSTAAFDNSVFSARQVKVFPWSEGLGWKCSRDLVTFPPLRILKNWWESIEWSLLGYICSLPEFQPCSWTWSFSTKWWWLEVLIHNFDIPKSTLCQQTAAPFSKRSPHFQAELR